MNRKKTSSKTGRSQTKKTSKRKVTKKARPIKSDGSIGDILIRLQEDFISQELFFIRDLKIFSAELFQHNIQLLTELKTKYNQKKQKLIEFFYFDQVFVIGAATKDILDLLLAQLVPANQPKAIDLRSSLVHIGKRVIVKIGKKKLNFKIDKFKDAEQYLEHWAFCTRKNMISKVELTPESLIQDFHLFGNNIKSLRTPKKQSNKKPFDENTAV